MIKTLIGTLSALSVLVMGTPSLADDVNAHLRLANEVRDLGINIRINPKRCAVAPTLGWYGSIKGELVICQENGTPGGEQVAWSSEDFDTLRHEAHHLVQDCMDRRRNGLLDPVYDDPFALAKDHLSYRTINWIINDGYSQLSEYHKLLELEAFAVASMNDPMEQVRDILNYCY